MLAQATAEAEAIVARHPGARIEHKPASVVGAHPRHRPGDGRGGPAGGGGRAGRGVPGVHVMPGKQVVELAVLTTNKGTALVDLRAGPRRGARRSTSATT